MRTRLSARIGLQTDWLDSGCRTGRRGKIDWDSNLNALDPTFEMFDPWVTREITVRDTYAHRSGLPDYAGDLLEDLGFHVRKFYFVCVINVPIAVFVRITPTRILA